MVPTCWRIQICRLCCCGIAVCHSIEYCSIALAKLQLSLTAAKTVIIAQGADFLCRSYEPFNNSIQPLFYGIALLPFFLNYFLFILFAAILLIQPESFITLWIMTNDTAYCDINLVRDVNTFYGRGEDGEILSNENKQHW